MAKFELDLKNVVVEIDNELMKKSKGKITDDVMLAFFDAFAALPFETKKKMVNKIYTLDDESLNLEDLKVGAIVETVSDGIAGMITKVNKKTIAVATKKGVLSGPPTAFKLSDKTVDELKAERLYYTFDTAYEGTFVKVLIGGKEWQEGIVTSNSRGKVRVDFYDKDTYVTLRESQAQDKKLVQLDGGTVRTPEMADNLTGEK